ncbi:acyl-CoA dehydrogenase family protein [Nocardioides sp. GCM10027113]|uniref:acyl-CoA dehydrogenase family protein n=1 Tax=unclassified Nocardioides TaxID=2615069 RepID=UPI00361B422B
MTLVSSRQDAADAGTPFGELMADLAPVLADIAAGAPQRERDGVPPGGAMRRLKELGLGAARLPGAYGGRGLGIVDLVRLWVALAEADPNLTQALRGHFAVVEDLLWRHARGEDQQRWFERFVAGQTAGNAWAEPPGTELGRMATEVVPGPAPGDLLLRGVKNYTTGCAYAEWADVRAVRVLPDGSHEDVVVLVDLRLDGVSVVDDWDGFGQRGTATGTVTFRDVPVRAGHVVRHSERFDYQSTFFQLNLLATLVGIGRRAVGDLVQQLRTRDRHFSHGNAARVRDDAQALAHVGELSAAVFAAEAATLRVAAAVQQASRAVDRVRADWLELAEVECAAAQVVVTRLVLDVTSRFLDPLGASATSRALCLDRHWRNARTVASHNPVQLKARVVGDHRVNHAAPPRDWAVGRTRREAPSVGAVPGHPAGGRVTGR